MFRFVILLAATVAAVSATPGAVLAAYTTPVVAPAVVTAHSSQVIARNHNGLAVPLIAAAPLKAVATPFGAYYKTAPVAVAAPLHAGPVTVGALVKAAPVTVAARLQTAPVAVAAPLNIAAKPFAAHYKVASFSAVPVATKLKFTAPYTFGAPIAAPLSAAPAYYF